MIAETAQVSDRALVFGSARAYGSARVFDSAWVYGMAWVYDSAVIKGDGRVSKRGDWITVGPVGTGNTITAHRDAVIGWRVNAGCWSGTLAGARRNLTTEHLHPNYEELDDDVRAHHIAQVRAALTFIAAHIKNEDAS